MSGAWLAVLIAFSVITSGVIAANMVITMMIGEINRKRQDGRLVSYFGYTFEKLQLIFAEYRKNYPDGRLHIYAIASISIAAAVLAGSVVLLRLNAGPFPAVR